MLQRYGLQLHPDCLKAAQGIERAAKRMNRLLQDLLDVTSMEAGRLALDVADDDLDGIRARARDHAHDAHGATIVGTDRTDAVGPPVLPASAWLTRLCRQRLY